MQISIQEIEDTLKQIFTEEEGLVKSVDSVYEATENGYKLVISIHNISIEDTVIIHTKFIFKTDKEKRYVIDSNFIYLYEINCVYHSVGFNSVNELQDKIHNIIKSNDFGKDLISISDFISAPAMFLNYYFKRENISEYSIFEVKYEPKFKITPCEKTTFDFEININNNYDISVVISKLRTKDKKEYKFKFKLLDKHHEIVTDELNNIHVTIGKGLIEMMEDTL